MADSWASRQRRSTESEADAEAFRRDLDGGDDFRLDEVATLSDNNRVRWQICNVFSAFLAPLTFKIVYTLDGQNEIPHDTTGLKGSHLSEKCHLATIKYALA